jgi:aspartyl-tRNA(Asn)/glutamyl-tRNA(Gln) amidotransferase subunit A
VFGALVTSVADAARHLDVTAGPHDSDRLTLPAPQVRYEDAIETLDVAGLRALWSTDMGFATVDPEVADLAETAGRGLVAAAGLQQTHGEVSLSDPTRVWLSCGVLDLYMDLEAGMWPDHGDDLTDYIRGILNLTDQATPARIAGIWKRRQRLDSELAELFSHTDVLLTPTTAVPAYQAEWPMPSEIDGVRVHPSMNVPFTMAANLGWHPAISVPAGTTHSGLPVGLQIQCRRHADEVVLRLARIFEQARPWPRLAPAAS